MRDEEVRQFQSLLQIVEQIQNLRLHRHVERGGRLVQNDEARIQRERARDADALALSAGEFVRETIQMLTAQVHQFEQFDDARGQRFAAQARVNDERLGDDVVHGEARVERRVRVLEDDLHFGAAAAHFFRRQLQNVHAVEAHLPERRLFEAQEATRNRALARPRFADKTEAASCADRKTHAVHRFDRPDGAAEHSAAQWIVFAQVFNLE